MRNAFVEEIVQLAARDERVVLLTGDLGFSVLEPFSSQFPDRFYNVGVAEQNMVGLATGLAEAGYLPFVYSIATFASMRPYEFIRNGPALHRLPVRIVGIGGGFEYGPNGVSHFALEDLAIMRAQPNISVLAPADAAQARAAVRWSAHEPSSIYFRVGKTAAPVPGLEGRFTPGRIETIGEGTDVALIAVGASALTAVDAAEILRADGIDATVAVVSSLRPAPVEDLAQLLTRVSLAVTIEAHYIVGGLGSLVCEVVAEAGFRCRIIRRGVDRMPGGLSGTQAHLEHKFGISADAVAATIGEALNLQVQHS
jgi:transketolase